MMTTMQKMMRMRMTMMMTLMQASCGNGRLDPGEQCENKGTGCCTDRCVLRPGADCNIGHCCTKDCRFKPAGTVCRVAAADSCDEVRKRTA